MTATNAWRVHVALLVAATVLLALAAWTTATPATPRVSLPGETPASSAVETLAVDE